MSHACCNCSEHWLWQMIKRGGVMGVRRHLTLTIPPPRAIELCSCVTLAEIACLTQPAVLETKKELFWQMYYKFLDVSVGTNGKNISCLALPALVYLDLFHLFA